MLWVLCGEAWVMESVVTLLYWLKLEMCNYGQVTQINLKRGKAHSFNFGYNNKASQNVKLITLKIVDNTTAPASVASCCFI